MANFERSLRQHAQQELRAIVNCTAAHWWKDFLQRWVPSGSHRQNGLRLALRGNYLNFYSEGRSIGEVRFGRGGTPYVKTHAKYVFGREQKIDKYVVLSGDQYTHPISEMSYTYDGPATLERWIDFAQEFNRHHDGNEKNKNEKRIVDLVISANPSVIDVEMGLPAIDVAGTSPDTDKKRPAPRIDLVALERCGNRIKVVFWEVKLIGDARLVSRDRPKVLEQLEAYRVFLSDSARRQHVIEAYANTCAHMLMFHDMARQLGSDLPALDPMVHEVAANPAVLDIDPVPRLLVHGKPNSIQHTHLNRFKEPKFGPIPVLVVDGDSPLTLRQPEAWA